MIIGHMPSPSNSPRSNVFFLVILNFFYFDLVWLDFVAVVEVLTVTSFGLYTFKPLLITSSLVLILLVSS
jgi:hypothetical protein